MSGYLYFKKTGIQAIDKILDRVWSASRAYHHTEGWIEPYDESKGEDSETYVDRIQQAADEASKSLWTDDDMKNAYVQGLIAPYKSLCATAWLEQYKGGKNN